MTAGSSHQPGNYFGDLSLTLPQDKRHSKRVKYCSYLAVNQQRPELPPPAEFATVEARDLSQTGLSFYCPVAPADRWLILMIEQSDGEPYYMTARVVRCEKDYDDAHKRFIVGCEFTGRLKRLDSLR